MVRIRAPIHAPFAIRVHSRPFVIKLASKMKYFYIMLLLALSMSTRAQDPAYPAAPATVLQVTAAEYFIDTDPGAGNGTTIVLTPGVNISNLAASVSLTGLTNGVHRLYIRTRSADGKWSITSQRDFLYDADIVCHAPPPAPQNIIAAEYFIDTDPGAGGGTAIPVTPGLTLNNVPVSVNTSSLSMVYIVCISAQKMQKAPGVLPW